MVHLLSIHVPKTAGTSFYRVLQANYPDSISESLRREHVADMKAKGMGLEEWLPQSVEVVHGHITVREALPLIETHKPKLIAFLRDPVERVISNYVYFIHTLKHPELGLQAPGVYEENKHRVHESIYRYAELPENRNVMWHYLDGLPLERFYFVGLQEHYRKHVGLLSDKLGWQYMEPPVLNTRPELGLTALKVTQEMRYFLRKVNELDVALYAEALKMYAQRSAR